MALTRDQRKTVTYTSLMTSPAAVRLSLPALKRGKKKIVFPWVLNIRLIVIYVISFFLVQYLFGSLIQVVGRIIKLADYALSFVIPYFVTRGILSVPTEGKHIERYLFDTLRFFFFVVVPKKEMYKGSYRMKPKNQAILVPREYD